MFHRNILVTKRPELIFRFANHLVGIRRQIWLAARNLRVGSNDFIKDSFHGVFIHIKFLENE